MFRSILVAAVVAAGFVFAQPALADHGFNRGRGYYPPAYCPPVYRAPNRGHHVHRHYYPPARVYSPYSVYNRYRTYRPYTGGYYGNRGGVSVYGPRGGFSFRF